ncbi:copper resistance CopC family protein [Nocardiopsis chromatogenes]|uniref:copper resistance CopC family protein n=1 Tax=Nocardiopsis chromatogenes TaxID=280239 RepID=UPI00034590EA|nr:copper resistance CopC family protein [Nocardiopsis chromatogenes]
MVLTAPAAPALAHDRLVSSTPEAEERLASGPDEVELVFSGEVMDVGAAVTVLDADGAQVSQGEAGIDGDTVAQGLSETLPDGGYVVRWRVVSSDGHPISGAFSFAVGEDAGLLDPAAASPAADTPGTAASDDAAEDGAQAQADGAARSGVPLWGVAGVGAAVGLLLYLAVSTVLARRRRSD